MAKTRQRTLISALLLFGTVALAGGTAALATNPLGDMTGTSEDSREVTAARGPAELRARSMMQPKAMALPSPSTNAPGGSAPATAAKPAPSAAQAPAPKTITYVVLPGDTLAGIAAWFDQRGFGELYRANRAVIGNDPDLILPGQEITIADGVMTVSPR